MKAFLVAYVIVMNVDRFRWAVLVRGAASGAVAAFLSGLFQIGIDVAGRSAGATNAIRFGMIAMALAAVCAVGVLYSRGDRVTAGLSFLGFVAGIGAALMSGSRGALLTLPFILILLAPVLWRRSRRAFVTVAVCFAVLTGAMLLSNVGNMATRMGYAVSNIASVLVGGDATTDRSVGDRTKLLVLAYQLFRESPLLGVGARGWNEAADKLSKLPDKNEKIAYPYNQAHNQYADDLAKGGLVRFLLGFVVLFLPLYLFFKCEPYSGRPDSQFALAGVVLSVAFMIFCLSESLMILSLSAIVHAALIFSLLKACDRTRNRAAASG